LLRESVGPDLGSRGRELDGEAAEADQTAKSSKRGGEARQGPFHGESSGRKGASSLLYGGVGKIVRTF
jgi:hypothetical protein